MANKQTLGYANQVRSRIWLSRRQIKLHMQVRTAIYFRFHNEILSETSTSLSLLKWKTKH